VTPIFRINPTALHRITEGRNDGNTEVSRQDAKGKGQTSASPFTALVILSS